MTAFVGPEAALAILKAKPPPGCSLAHWTVAQRGVRLFCQDGWAAKASAAGWTEEELYAVPLVWSRVDLCGAALLIGERKVVEVTKSTIVIEALSGGSFLKFYRATKTTTATDVAHVANVVTTGSN